MRPPLSCGSKWAGSTFFYHLPLTKHCVDAGKEKFQALESQPVRELLAQLAWTSVAEPALLRVVHSQVRHVIHATCGDEFSEKYLGRVEAWACVELLPWLDDLFQAHGARSTQSWRQVISQHVLQVRAALVSRW